MTFKSSQFVVFLCCDIVCADSRRFLYGMLLLINLICGIARWYKEFLFKCTAKWASYDRHTHIVHSKLLPSIWIGYGITKQFDKSGLAISQCIFYGKFSHCSDLPLRTALWCQFWHGRGAAAPVLSAFLCRWRVSPAFFGTYVDAPL